MKIKRIITAILLGVMALCAVAFAACSGGAEKHTVTFDTGGGTLISGSLTQDVSSAYQIAYPVLEREGYVLTEWSPKLNGAITEDVTVHAVWQARTYTITLDYNYPDANAAEEIKTLKVVYGEIPPNIGDPVFEGYDFYGWYIGEELLNLNAPYKTANDVTARAKWGFYTVTFNYGNGSGEILSVKALKGSYFNNLPTPIVVPSGQRFLGWKDENGLFVVEGTAYSYGKDITLTAVYEDFDDTKYLIEYNVNGGNGLSEDAVRFYSVSEEDIILPTVIRKGYIFIGWSSDGGEPVTSIKAGTVGNLTLTAVWQAKKFIITFNYEGGEGEETEREAEFGKQVNDLPVPNASEDGKSFEYWMLDGARFSEGTVYDFEHDITLYAVYGEYFTITFDNTSKSRITDWADGFSGVKTLKIKAGDKIIVPAIYFNTMNDTAKINEDYIFSYWYYKDKDGKTVQLDTDIPFTKENFNVDDLNITIFAKIRKQWAGPY